MRIALGDNFLQRSIVAYAYQEDPATPILAAAIPEAGHWHLGILGLVTIACLLRRRLRMVGTED
jgi:hypothetical protein